MVRNLDKMDNVELFDYLHNVPGHHSDYSSLYIYLAKHPPMDDYYRNLFKGLEFKTFLDLGPGVGASLDVAKEMGAKTKFVDRDIYITRYCENKGHEKIELDFFQKPLPDIGTFDLVLSRGSFNVDMMNETKFDIDYLIEWLLKTGKHIIVIPTWNKGEIVEGQDYTCVGKHFQDYMKSPVHDSFRRHGFTTFSQEGINDRLRFPITYEHKKNENSNTTNN